MTKPLRNKDPALYRLITIRTQEARMWMIPSRNMEKLLGGILARYSEILGIEIYAYCFLSNHFHLLIRAPRANTDEFCENLDREIARRVNWKLRRIGNFWHRRYDDQKVLSEDDLLDAFLYINTNAVRHGLVENAQQWPGLCSYNQCLSERDREFSFYYYSSPEPEDVVKRHRLALTVLPQLRRLSKTARHNELLRLFSERHARIHEARRAEGKGFLGKDAVIRQVPGSLPFEVSSSSRPCGYTTDPLLRKQERQAERQRRASYWEASARFRLGDHAVDFPEFCFKPPLNRKPRQSPFVPLPEDSFKNAA